MSSDFKCVACGDTGINSRGGPCAPCKVNGRQLLRAAVLGAVKVVFARCHEEGRLPDPCQLRSAIDWAYAPRTMYAAGYRGADGSMAMFAGPTVKRDNITCDITPDDNGPGPAYIVEITKAETYDGEPEVQPVMRWKGGEWVGKRNT